MSVLLSVIKWLGKICRVTCVVYTVRTASVEDQKNHPLHFETVRQKADVEMGITAEFSTTLIGN